MPDRLAELVRQRALVQEHLAWLNREIAAAAETAKAVTSPAGSTTAPPAPAPVVTLPVSTPPSGTTPPVPAATEADEIIARYQVTPAAMKQDVRKGCLLYFAGAFVLLGLVVAVLYLVLRQPR